MSNNDLISARNEILRTLNYINSSGSLDYEDYCELFDTINRAFLVLLKHLPQEMSAMEYLAAEQRMCFDENFGKRNCVNCPLSSSINPARINCGDYSREHPDKAVAAVEKWVREHPERIKEVNNEEV